MPQQLCAGLIMLFWPLWPRCYIIMYVGLNSWDPHLAQPGYPEFSLGSISQKSSSCCIDLRLVYNSIILKILLNCFQARRAWARYFILVYNYSVKRPRWHCSMCHTPPTYCEMYKMFNNLGCILEKFVGELTYFGIIYVWKQMSVKEHAHRGVKTLVSKVND